MSISYHPLNRKHYIRYIISGIIGELLLNFNLRKNSCNGIQLLLVKAKSHQNIAVQQGRTNAWQLLEMSIDSFEIYDKIGENL